MKKPFFTFAVSIAMIILGAVINPAMADAPYAANLLTNPSCDSNNYVGWTKIDNGSGWGAWDNNWKSSYNLCSMEQTVDLLSVGFTEEQLDALPYLFASGRFECPWAGSNPGIAKIIVYLLNSSDSILQTVTVKDTTYRLNDIPWTTYIKQVQIPVGTRKAKFYFAGKDCKGWSGQYGPDFDDMWLSLSTTNELPTKNITCATVDNGSFSVSRTTANYGDTVKITVTPSAKYGLKTFNVTKSTGATISVASDSSFIMPVGYDVTVSGTFWKIKDFSVTCATVDNGSFSVNKSMANYGDTVKITVTPASEYSLQAFNVTKSTGETITIASDSSFIMPVDSNVTVSGTFWKFTEVTTANPFTEGFETGNLNPWIQQSEQGSNVWTINSTSTDANRTPRTGSYNATLKYSSTEWLFTPLYLSADTTYDFQMYARQDMSDSSYANITVMLGNSANNAAMADTHIATKNITNGDYQKISGSITPTKSQVYVLGIKGYINGAPWYISIDDIAMAVHSQTVTSIATPSAENALKVYAQGHVIVIKNAATSQKASVFDVAGRCIISTPHRNIQMPQAGIYIVKIGNETRKVIIK